jgi:outer membrane receptor protein involved in Fe transport
MKFILCSRFSITRNPRVAAAASLLFSMLPASAFAQAITPAKTQASGEVVVLSPFVVNSDKDVGFVATSSLAGGRLAGDLKDTPAAYSVQTREFIDALGLTNLADAATWAVNVTKQPDDGRGEIFGDLRSGLTFRGVSAGAQRNFFPATGNPDSYNLDRYDYARGPNSILFGTGSLGGTGNVVTKSANPAKSLSEIKAMAGSGDDYRFTADFNRPLSRRLALRLNALSENSQGWRDRDFDNKSGATLAATWRPSDATELRAEFEGFRAQRSNGLTIVGDRLSGWDGTTVFTGSVATLPTDANSRGVGRATNFLWSPGSGTSGVMNYVNEAITLAANANAAVPLNGILVVGPSLSVSGNSMLLTQGLPEDRFSRAAGGSAFRLPGRSFTVSPDGPLFDLNYLNATVAVTHRQGDRLFSEVAGNWVRFHQDSQIGATRSLSDTFVDITNSLPNGQPNPNYLQPYNQAETTLFSNPVETYSYRAAMAYVLDNTRWGSFRFSLQGGGSHTLSARRFYTYVIGLDPDPRNWGTANLLRTRYYWNQRARPRPKAGTYDYYNPVTGTTTPASVTEMLDTRNGTINDQYSDPRYLQLAMTAKLLGGRLNFVGAARHDWYKASSKQSLLRKDYSTSWDTRTPQFAPSAPADYLTMKYVPKDSTGTPNGSEQLAITRPRDANGFGLAQYANDRFRDDFSPPDLTGGISTASAGAVFHVNQMISVFGNRAETYQAPSVLQRINSQLFSPTTSNGWDAGVRFTFGDGRVTLSASTYRSVENGQSIDTGTSSGFPVAIPSAINGILQANVIGDNSSGGRNKRGLEDVPSTYADLRDRSSEGYEVELVGNLTKSWRVTANFALPKAFQLNAFSDTRAFLSQNEATLKQIVIDAGGLIDAANVASIDTSIPINGRSPDVNNAVTQWNNLQVIKANIITAKQKITRLTEVSGNVFTDYTFREGRLAGLRVGAGVNYRGRTVIGYRGSDTIVSPNDPTVAMDDPSVNALNPVYTPGYSVYTATAGYKLKLKQGRTLVFDLRVSNLFNETDPIYYNTAQRPPGGSLTTVARVATPLAFYYQRPRSYTFTTTLNF